MFTSKLMPQVLIESIRLACKEDSGFNYNRETNTEKTVCLVSSPLTLTIGTRMAILPQFDFVGAEPKNSR
jgi:hypothetical protein